jgi:hypothetical protein
MANGAFKFKDNSGNVVASIGNNGSNIVITGGTLDLSGMSGLTIGNVTLSGNTENATSASHAASYLLTSSFNTYSGTTNTIIGTLATTGSNNFIGSQTITGSLYISQNLVVQGSSSLENITGSNVYIGTNKINLNTDTPSIRFGGVSVYDSGSNFGESGSLLWDSQNNRWLYQHPASSGAPYKSAIIISGPQNSGDLGSESTLTSGKIQKAVGDDHIGDSIITETGGGIGIGGNLVVTGSISSIGTGIVRSVIETTGGVQEPSLQFKTTLGSYYLGNYPNTSIFYFDNRTGYRTSFQVDGTEKVAIGATGNLSVTGSLTTTGAISINSTSTSQLNVYTSSVSTQNIMSEFHNGDYTSNTRNFIRVRNGINAGSTMSSYFGQGQDGKTYIISNDFTKNHIVIDGNSTYVGINKNTPNSQLDVNGNTTVTGSLVTTSNVTIGTSYSISQLNVGGQSSQTTGALTDSGTRNGLIEVLAAGGAAGNGGGIVFGSNTQGNDTGRGQVAIKASLINGAGMGTSDLVFSTRAQTSDTNLTERLKLTPSGVLQPSANGTQDLGSSSNRWGTVYTSDLSMSNGIGDYTIVEGLEDLFLYNNKTNKVFKFMLQEVDPSTATPKKS